MPDIVWLRLHGALRTGSACQCGRMAMMSLLACTHVLQASKNIDVESSRQEDWLKVPCIIHMIYTSCI